MTKKKKPPKKKTEGFVLDGSMALAWCFADEADPYADRVARKLPHVGAVVPVIWHLEVANAFVVGERRGRCDQADTSTWLTYLSSLPITVEDHNGPRVFSDVMALARAQNLSVYDAAYLELARRRDLPLATLDEPLKNAAAAIGVEPFDAA
jgi:predicted nucleic acid-binding protein